MHGRHLDQLKRWKGAEETVEINMPEETNQNDGETRGNQCQGQSEQGEAIINQESI